MKSIATRPYFEDFVSIVRDTCAAQLDGIELL
jgi:LysR family transcriptional regulator for metE and metH